MNSEERLIRIDENVQQLAKWAFGNGRPGAAERLSTLEVKYEEHETQTSASRGAAPAWAAVAVALLIFAWNVHTNSITKAEIRSLVASESSVGEG
jgi:hypothetical protein